MDDLPARIDHTVLGPTTAPRNVDAAVATAIELGTNVCVPPQHVERARERLDASEPSTTVGAGTSRGPGSLVTVVGFPHGQHATMVKRQEARLAAEAGADELDVVIDAGRLLAGDEDAFRSELESVVGAVDVPVKAIVCAPLLDDERIETACEIAAVAGCSHAKTATGFDGGGAAVEDVELMAEHLPVKASGGIGDLATARAMLDAGAVRIGASSGDAIVREWRAEHGRTE